MILIAATAVWLGFVARADRLRKVAASHMRQFEHRSGLMRDTDRAPAVEERRAGAEAAWHLKMATEYNIEADFVEAFQLAVLLALLGLGTVLVLNRRRRRSALIPRLETGPGPGD
ncbi:MAG: hypothetical protein P4L84_06260 [Isosphaeraceae bacterium]|nr:hypothetical protein [Isosphaeraceae bacterium]